MNIIGRSRWAFSCLALVVLLFVAAIAVHAGAAQSHVTRRIEASATPTATTGVPAQPQAANAYPTVGKPAKGSGASYSLVFSGKPVNFDLSGMEPDFDPIYKVIVTSTLHDGRKAPHALPDATLILSAYLEAFQPDTTPVLPDLLHTDQQAMDLGGFLSGKAALVNIGGHVVYRGSLLAEIFQDNREHLVVDLDPVSPGKSVRVEGVITLHRGGSEAGTLRALAPFASAALAVPRGRAPSWQNVVNGMNVSKPAMMGTAGSPAQQTPAKPTTIAPLTPAQGSTASCDTACRFRRPSTMGPLVLGGLILLVGVVTGWRRWRR
jgi:hypothetical protein